jgi:hypothetical protein
VQMNIADKRTFYGQIARGLTPRGRLLFHEVFQGPGGALHYPSRTVMGRCCRAILSSAFGRSIAPPL